MGDFEFKARPAIVFLARRIFKQHSIHIAGGLIPLKPDS